MRKQLTYELAVQQLDIEQNIENQLWTPYYRKQDESKGTHDMGEYIPDCELVTILESNAIRVFKIDFMKLQAFYAQS